MLLAGASCKIQQAPKSELCLGTKQGDLACDDPRLNEGEQSYFRELNSGDVCTNPDDYKSLLTFVNKLNEDLAKCRARQ